MPGSEAIGIIAGGGAFPSVLAYTLQQQGKTVFIVGIAGFVDPLLLEPFPHCVCRLAAVGDILKVFRQHNCRELVLIGPIKRPAWRDLRPDAEGAHFLMRLGRNILKGDDGLLAAIVNLLEEKGFSVRGAHEFLREAVGSEGVLSLLRPDEQAQRDIVHAAYALRVMAPLDVGQGCVVQKGLILALEAQEGTDVMLQRCYNLKQDGDGGILLKMPKINQEIRADMPVIGPETIRQAAKAGLRGVSFAAGMTLLIDYKECIAEANRLGLFLYGYSSYD